MNSEKSGVYAYPSPSGEMGMNMLEVFTLAAMQGMLAHSSKAMPPAKTLAEQALKYAEATLAELSKPQHRSSSSSENSLTK